MNISSQNTRLDYLDAARAFAEFPLHWSIKLASISVLTIFISIVLYDLFIRSTFFGAVLNGKAKPRFLFYPTVRKGH